MNSFKPVIPEHCVVNAADEMDNVFNDTGVMFDFGDAIDSEIAAIDTVKEWLSGLLDKK